MAEESGYKATATSYPGVAFIVGTHPSTGKPDKIFYISYYRGGKRKHEKAGRASIDGMTAAKANAIRTLRMEGKELPNRDRRAAEEAARKAQEGRWTFDRLWEEWKKANGSKPSRVNDDNRYKNHLKDPFGDKEPRELVPLDVDRLRVRLLKASAPPPGRKFDPNAKRREDYSEKKKKARGGGGEAGAEALRGRDREVHPGAADENRKLRAEAAIMPGALVQDRGTEGREDTDGGYDRGADDAVYPDVPGVAGSPGGELPAPRALHRDAAIRSPKIEVGGRGPRQGIPVVQMLCPVSCGRQTRRRGRRGGTE